MSYPNGSVLMIVEETVQHAYLISPDSPKIHEIAAKLKALATGPHIEHIPMSWDRPPGALEGYLVKGQPMPTLTMREAEDFKTGQHSTYTKFTIVLPDENGEPCVKQTFTNKTATQTAIPLKKRRK